MVGLASSCPVSQLLCFRTAALAQPCKILLQLFQARIDAHLLRCPLSGKAAGRLAFACGCLRHGDPLRF
jgi:hypothetical protein